MKFYYIFQESIQALFSSALRSALTIVGIVVGIFSVTAMLALGEGLTTNILDRFDNFIAGDITISGDLTYSDLKWVSEQPYVEAVLGNQSANNVEVIAQSSDFNPAIVTSIGDYDAVKGLTLISGTAFDFSDVSFSEYVAVVDEGFLNKVSEETGYDVSTGSIIINGQRFTVIGIVEGGGGGFGRRSDGTVIIPYAAALGVVTNTKQFSSIGVNLVEQEYYDIAAQNILESLNVSRNVERDSDSYFSVISAQEAIDSAQETTKMLSLFLGIVGGIALFVGGIGTMNMMLTTVTERTKEIGLRKAIGARDQDILLQILVESVLLTVIGGVIGIGLTYGAAYLANQALGPDGIISVVMSGTVVMYATIVSFVVGIVFGIYPARNASKLQPVDALRAD